MTQIPTQFDAGSVESTERAPFSLTAILSFVFSLIFCVPGVAFIGLLLGIFGVVRTAGGARRGRGLAITGSILSLAVLAGWISMVVLGWPYVKGTMDVTMTGPQSTLKAAFDGDSTTAQKYFLPRSRPGKEQLATFASKAESRWGTFQGVSYTNPQRRVDDKSPVPISVRFDSGIIPGVVSFSAGDDVGKGDGPEDLAFMQVGPDGFVSFLLIESITLKPTEGPVLTLGGRSGDLPQGDSDESSEAGEGADS